MALITSELITWPGVQLGRKLYYYKKQGEKLAGLIDLKEATGCRADETDPEQRTFKILYPGDGTPPLYL